MLRFGRPQVECAVRPLPVVVVDVDTQHAFEVAAVEDQQPVEALGAHGSDEALGDRVRFGRANRRPDDLDAFATEDVVEVTRELAVAIADQEANRSRSFRQGPGELASLLADPGAVWVGRAASEVNASAAKLDVEEHVQAPQGNSLDGEEVDGEHALRLRAQELAPRESGALTGRPEASLADEVAHQTGRDCVTQPAEFADDALVASARILAREA